MSDTAVMSPDDMEVLRQMREKNAKPVFVSYDSIKFKDSEKRIEGLTRGHFYVESFDGENKHVQDIGANPEIIVLHRCYTYSYYKDGEGLLAWTSDIQGFTPQDRVVLFSKKGGRASVEFDGVYPEFKQHLEQHYVVRQPDGFEKKLMTFQNLLYVMYEGKVCRMFVSNASTAGIPDGEKAPNFKNPQPGSLLQFIETTRGEQMDAALPESICRLGSRFKDDVEQPYYIRTFENAGKTPEDQLLKAVQEYRKLTADIVRQQSSAVERATEIVEAEVIPHYQSEVRVEDLPF